MLLCERSGYERGIARAWIPSAGMTGRRLWFPRPCKGRGPAGRSLLQLVSEREDNGLDYRVLSRDDINNLAQIDRSESIDSIYYVRNGDVVLVEEH